VCASAGNHGQGLAYACSALGVRGRVYVPRTTPRQKRDRMAALGGEVVTVEVVGDTYDDAAAAPWPTRRAPARCSCRPSTTSARSPGRARS
jgi:threonine dehydratase